MLAISCFVPVSGTARPGSRAPMLATAGSAGMAEVAESHQVSKSARNKTQKAGIGGPGKPASMLFCVCCCSALTRPNICQPAGWNLEVAPGTPTTSQQHARPSHKCPEHSSAHQPGLHSFAPPWPHSRGWAPVMVRHQNAAAQPQAAEGGHHCQLGSRQVKGPAGEEMLCCPAQPSHHCRERSVLCLQFCGFFCC